MIFRYLFYLFIFQNIQKGTPTHHQTLESILWVNQPRLKPETSYNFHWNIKTADYCRKDAQSNGKKEKLSLKLFFRKMTHRFGFLVKRRYYWLWHFLIKFHTVPTPWSDHASLKGVNSASPRASLRLGSNQKYLTAGYSVEESEKAWEMCTRSSTKFSSACLFDTLIICLKHTLTIKHTYVLWTSFGLIRTKQDQMFYYYCLFTVTVHTYKEMHNDNWLGCRKVT